MHKAGCVATVTGNGLEEEAMWLVVAIERRWRNNEATVGSKKKGTKNTVMSFWGIGELIILYTTTGGDTNIKFFRMLANSHRITNFIGDLAINGFVLTQEPK